MRASRTSIEAREGQSGVIVMTIRDEAGALVPLAALDSITLDLYSWFAGAGTVINARDHQSVLNANGGEYFDALQSMTDEDGKTVQFNFRWTYGPADTPFLQADTYAFPTEDHIAHFRFTWADGAKAIGHEVRMVVTNFRRFTTLT